MAQLLPATDEILQLIQSNKERWATMVDQYEERMQKEK